MISYFPHYREEPEILLKDHPLFDDVAESDKYEQFDKKEQKLDLNDIVQDRWMQDFQVGFRFS